MGGWAGWADAVDSWTGRMDKCMDTSHPVVRHPAVTIYTRHTDVHLYLFSHWVLDLLMERPNICSVQGELIPLLTRYQFSSLSHKCTAFLSG